MPDLLSEIQQAILRSIQVSVDESAAQRAWDDRSAASSPAHALGMTPEAMQDVLFTTGYNTVTGVTTTGFMFDISTLNGPDILL